MVDFGDLFVGQLAANLHPVLSRLELQYVRDAVLQHQVSLAYTLLVPCRPQCLGLRLAAILERFSPPASAVVALPQRLVRQRLDQELPRLLGPAKLVLVVDIAAL